MTIFDCHHEIHSGKGHRTERSVGIDLADLKTALVIKGWRRFFGGLGLDKIFPCIGDSVHASAHLPL